MPFRFFLTGIPISSQSTSALQLQWRDIVRKAAINYEYLPGNYDCSSPFLSYVAVEIVWYLNEIYGTSTLASMTFGNLDNFAKPILDAIANPKHHHNPRPIIENHSLVSCLSIRKTPLSQIARVDGGDNLQRKARLCEKEGLDFLEFQIVDVWHP
jgi:hypothetical protein